MSEQSELVVVNDEGFVPRYDGEWFSVGDEHILTCCHCGLVHYCQFRVRDGVIEMSAIQRDDLTKERRNSLKDRDSEIGNLEWRVVEAAVAKRKAELEMFPGGVHLSVSRYAFEPYIRAEEAACDALIALREKVEI